MEAMLIGPPPSIRGMRDFLDTIFPKNTKSEVTNLSIREA